MIYEVWLTAADGTFSENIYNPSDANKILIEPRLSMEINKPGSLEFRIPESNIGYLHLDYYTATVDVVENSKVIWTGRITEIDIDLNKIKTVKCEGALAFFNDIVLPYKEYKDITIEQFLYSVITDYNANSTVSLVIPTQRSFMLGTVTLDGLHMNKSVWRCTDYKSAWDTISNDILDAEGGYFTLVKPVPGNEPITINYSYEFGDTINQTIELGKNISSFSEGYDVKDIVTHIIPVCHYNDCICTVKSPMLPHTPDAWDFEMPENVLMLDDGTFINTDLVSKYGVIQSAVEFDMVESLLTVEGNPINIDRIIELQEKTDDGTITAEEAEEYFELCTNYADTIVNQQTYMALTAAQLADELKYKEFSADISAVDLKYMIDNQETIDMLELGCRVIVKVPTHNFITNLPITKLDINLDSAAKSVTIGFPEKRYLTDIFDMNKSYY